MLTVYQAKLVFCPENESPSFSWGNPKTEMLIDFLGYHQHWDPSYILQRMVPMLSTIFLREMVSNSTEGSLLNGQYEFGSIQRVKIRYGHPYYSINWKKPASASSCSSFTIQTEQCDNRHEELSVVNDEFVDLDEPDAPQIIANDGCWCLLTDESMDLVQAAFPEKVHKFLQEKLSTVRFLSVFPGSLEEMKGSKSRKRKELETTPKSSGVQLSITEFYRSTKVLVPPKAPVKKIEDRRKRLPEEKKNTKSPNLSKSVRRKLLFN
ncbi:hypothetical protein GIB67_019245 [Kingdonia uniflora]|uniref:Uncharacterized protein n=1 Tax=Kingdonia uniflora TaxID=39325 RepID=A0A7J7N017_9MAGN|nr:hypothetical protein GIB67_019245 [Kingdonia uniflora]